ncbi:trihelix transcription factor ASR3 [Canna indica]|uniref:Trihelix transcription factor ASR3 n=1 Tax=Canna indica TaxID=4628 RepID=A0AAQ3QAP9_9LILI|nr:trihelix transcription factor ASR3 [Canna indica]
MAHAVETGGSNGHDGGGAGAGGRPPRLPRWTRQEILVLIQGKRVVESRGRVRGMGRAAAAAASGGGGGDEAMVVSAAPVEPKWASVSSYCRRHGVNRGPVQCRKRWSNLAGDFKKIKEWEGKGKESFWTMRNDLRRERRLPGFFDREVFDILDGAAVPEPEPEVEPAAEEDEGKKGGGRAAAAGGGEEEETAFDSGRTAVDDGSFSDFEEEKEAEDDDDDDTVPPTQPVAAVPISAFGPLPCVEKRFESSQQGRSDPAMGKDKQQADNPERSSPLREGHKRRRTSPEAADDIDLQTRLIQVLEMNSRMMAAQLEAQNRNSQLDRDQRKDQANSFLIVLGKLADALGRIADKL